ncbi:hypothetical protein D3C87_1170380 [compost metagenome]
MTLALFQLAACSFNCFTQRCGLSGLLGLGDCLFGFGQCFLRSFDALFQDHLEVLLSRSDLRMQLRHTQQRILLLQILDRLLRTIRSHDLLHDLCRGTVKDAQFLSILHCALDALDQVRHGPVPLHRVIVTRTEFHFDFRFDREVDAQFLLGRASQTVRRLPLQHVDKRQDHLVRDCVVGRVVNDPVELDTRLPQRTLREELLLEARQLIVVGIHGEPRALGTQLRCEALNRRVRATTNLTSDDRLVASQASEQIATTPVGRVDVILLLGHALHLLGPLRAVLELREHLVNDGLRVLLVLANVLAQGLRALTVQHAEHNGLHGVAQRVVLVNPLAPEAIHVLNVNVALGFQLLANLCRGLLDELLAQILTSLERSRQHLVSCHHRPHAYFVCAVVITDQDVATWGHEHALDDLGQMTSRRDRLQRRVLRRQTSGGHVPEGVVWSQVAILDRVHTLVELLLPTAHIRAQQLRQLAPLVQDLDLRVLTLVGRDEHLVHGRFAGLGSRHNLQAHGVVEQLNSVSTLRQLQNPLVCATAK